MVTRQRSSLLLSRRAKPVAYNLSIKAVVAAPVRPILSLSSPADIAIQRICFRMGYRERSLTARDDYVPESTQSSRSAELRLDLERALEALEPRHLEVLLLRDMYGYSAEEVATRLHISAEAVKSRLHRARTNMRQTLEGR